MKVVPLFIALTLAFLSFNRAYAQTAVAIRSNNGATPQSRTISVPLQKDESGTFAVPTVINKAVRLLFVIDSGASDVTIPADIVFEMLRTGTLKETDFIGSRPYKLANGTTVISRVFLLHTVQVDDKIVEGVVASESPVKGGLLLGQSFLGRFKSWSLDNDNEALILGEPKSNSPPIARPIPPIEPSPMWNFGAIAFSLNTGRAGWSSNFLSREQAEDTALTYCGSDCRVVVWFRNACGALAVGERGYGASWGNTQSEAEGNAMSLCNTNTTSCGIRRWQCTRRYL